MLTPSQKSSYRQLPPDGGAAMNNLRSTVTPDLALFKTLPGGIGYDPVVCVHALIARRATPMTDEAIALIGSIALDPRGGGGSRHWL